MTRKPKILMSADAMPKQRSPEETFLPARPDGFVGFNEWQDSMPAEARPQRRPRNVEYLGSAEWAWSPMHSRYDSYYLGKRGRYWCLWVTFRDENEDGCLSRWELYGWARRGREDWEAAAVHLLIDAWRQDPTEPGRFHWAPEAGHFSAVGLNCMADEAWG